MAPPIVPAVKLKVVPSQTGELLDAAGAAGVWFMVTAVVPADPVHPPGKVAVTE